MSESVTKYIKGENPWMDNKMIDITMSYEKDSYESGKSTKFVFTDDLPIEVYSIMAVYEFYNACAIHKLNAVYEGADMFIDEDEVPSGLPYPLVQIKTIAYFGSDFIKANLKKYKKYFPTDLFDTLSSLTKNKIPKESYKSGISILYADGESGSPFPKCVPII